MQQPAKRNFSNSGTVHQVLRGAAQLEEILDSGWCYDYAVLVDYTVPHCGPCRMLAPLLETFARQYKGKVAVVKIDCQSTVENRNLASAQGIQGYPTVQIYSDKNVKKEIRGLNQQEIVAALAAESDAMQAKQLKSSRAASEMAENLADEMEKIKEEENAEDFLAMSRTILTYMRNIALHPEEQKYRRIRLSNKHFLARLGSKPRGLNCMKIIGFEEITEENDEKWLVMKTVPQSFIKVAKLLGQAIPTGSTSSHTTRDTVGNQVTPQQLSNLLQSIMGQAGSHETGNH